MGGIIGGVIGGIGSIFGGKSAASEALTGYKYLTGKNGVQPIVDQGKAANANISALLNGGPNSAAASAAYGNYLNSTGYNFQLKQGTAALTGSAAARGILNSGATAKALTGYGQDLAKTSFNNYLNQEDVLSKNALTASGQIGQAGTQGGQAAAQATQSGVSSGANQLGSAAGGLYNFFQNL